LEFVNLYAGHGAIPFVSISFRKSIAAVPFVPQQNILMTVGIESLMSPSACRAQRLFSQERKKSNAALYSTGAGKEISICPHAAIGAT
jgi:hypothetical protein